MNKQMKRWLEDAIFIGFTGTPLLRKDKQMTRDVFGTYIHTYKFHEGVADERHPRPEVRGPRRAAAAHLAGGHRRVVRAEDQRR